MCICLWTNVQPPSRYFHKCFVDMLWHTDPTPGAGFPAHAEPSHSHFIRLFSFKGTVTLKSSLLCPLLRPSSPPAGWDPPPDLQQSWAVPSHHPQPFLLLTLIKAHTFEAPLEREEEHILEFGGNIRWMPVWGATGKEVSWVQFFI